MKKIILLGAGGHSKVVIDTIDKNKYTVIGLIDSTTLHLHERVNGIEIIGNDIDLAKYYPHEAVGAFVAIGHVGNYDIRNNLFVKIKEIGYEIINVIHKSAILSNSVKIGYGNLIMPNAIINAHANIGDNNIINTGVIVEHDVILEDGIHLAPGVIVCGECHIHKNVLVGAGSVVIQGVTIGENSVVGAGSLVLSDVPPNVTAVGSPAKIIKRRM